MENTVDSAQSTPPAEPPVDSAQVATQPVTAAGSTPADNATPPQVNPQGPPQTAGGGQTGAGVDDEPKMVDEAYEAEKAAFLAATPPGPQKSVLEQMASPADLAAQGYPVPGLTHEPPAPSSSPTVPPPVPVTATPPVPEDDLDTKDGKLPRFNNVRAADAIDVQALAAYKAAQRSNTLGGKSMVQFMAGFAAQNSPPAPAAGDASHAPPATSTPSAQAAEPGTVAGVDAELQRLRDKRYKALEMFDFAKAAEIERSEDALRAKREELREAEMSQQQQLQESLADADTKALARAATMFPQATDANSALVAKMSEVYAGWEESGDPRANTGNRYLYAYIEAADALGIPPSAGPAPVPVTPSVQPTSTPTPVHRPPVAAILASGGARDIPRAPVSDNLSDYEAEKAAFLGGRRAA